MNIRKTLTLTALIAGTVVSTGVFAAHAWSTYHWARMADSMPLVLVDSMSGGGTGTTEQWDYTLNQAQSEWNRTTALGLIIEQGDESRRARKKCDMITGKMHVCNAAYGNNGWLGLASINLDSNGHISQATAKHNDSYSSYWDGNPGERENVVCQEVGHAFGLDHTSTDGSDQNTCMDYSNSIAVTGINQHDIDQMVAIYNHFDSYNSYDDGTNTGGGTCRGRGCNKRANADGPPMGVRVNKSGRSETWVAADGNGGLWIHVMILVPEDY